MLQEYIRQRRRSTLAYRIINVQDRWRERTWLMGDIDQWVYRVETDPPGLFELSMEPSGACAAGRIKVFMTC